MTSFVPKGNKAERCRAKDPAHCRYHVKKDGTVMKHYPSLEACRKAIEDEAKRRNTSKQGLSKAGKVTSGMSREAMIKAITGEDMTADSKPKKRRNSSTGRVLDLNNLRKPRFTGNVMAEADWEKTYSEYRNSGKEAILEQQKIIDGANDRLGKLREMRRAKVEDYHQQRVEEMNDEMARIGGKASALASQIEQARKDGVDSDMSSLIGRTLTIADDVQPSGDRYIAAIANRSSERGRELASPAVLKDVQLRNSRCYMTLVGEDGHEFKQSLPEGMIQAKSINDRAYDDCRTAMDNVDRFNSMDKGVDHTNKMVALYKQAASVMGEPQSPGLRDLAFNESGLNLADAEDNKLKDMVNERRKHVHDLGGLHEKAALKLAGIQAMSSMHYTSEEDSRPLVDRLAKANAGLGDFDVLGTNGSKSRFLIRTHSDRYADYAEYSNGVGSAHDDTSISIVDGRGRTVISSIKDDDGTVRKLRLENLDVSMV